MRAPDKHSAKLAVPSHAARPGSIADEEVDLIFHALSDGTRRDIVRRCLEGESSVSGLAGSYPMSFAAVQKHVAVLERAGLITKQRNGREQIVRTDVETIRRARDMLDQLERTWRGRVGRMDALLGQIPDPDSRSTLGDAS